MLLVAFCHSLLRVVSLSVLLNQMLSSKQFRRNTTRYLFVMVVEYSKQGTASSPLANQMTARASLALLLDILCCNGRTIAMYLQRKETQL